MIAEAACMKMFKCNIENADLYGMSYLAYLDLKFIEGKEVATVDLSFWDVHSKK